VPSLETAATSGAVSSAIKAGAWVDMGNLGIGQDCVKEGYGFVRLCAFARMLNSKRGCKGLSSMNKNECDGSLSMRKDGVRR